MHYLKDPQSEELDFGYKSPISSAQDDRLSLQDTFSRLEDGIFTPQQSNIQVTPQLIQAQTLDDQAILKAVASERTPYSSFDAFAQLIARKMLALRIENGAELILPLVSFIKRTIKALGNDAPQTLAGLQARILEESNLDSRIQLSMLLGDTATSFAAGWITNRHLHRVMRSEELYRYANGMAIGGYVEAISLALRDVLHSNSKSVPNKLQPLVDRFPSGVRVLHALQPKKIPKDMIN
ncbi:MAG: hypothetical protein UR28_C0016G0006 [Candidatus Peregrinibacteria bacterium GW2011_GWF2_33_10]|nr:MAG: hypothetical protein UR28_C0016G0006 [Candidatus Peregrinibacteria bacterium GW2011_GWF2_33_10]OGJ45845.1 MAG: hypothetical protein A2263_03575 [Candidatus Peregrinibacteria bacterium RIFOXYA2_FULL_33_21]OGJ46486.1 MAG: hypothetical protein A2272_03540 [Candidatus Peregrinibacteria bacterium RIFOXYA12_FULL_33_12]OGJ51363.1 MAG: hypothetical protein A2307_02320 [Candidatus Peregrinibacteria bacterium RIFOXYB2_FULL_33_20]